jgi:hypothetical protein
MVCGGRGGRSALSSGSGPWGRSRGFGNATGSGCARPAPGAYLVRAAFHAFTAALVRVTCSTGLVRFDHANSTLPSGAMT